MRVVAVLRSGGEYRQEHAERLRSQVERQGVRFELLGDTIFSDHRLEHDWPGWWSKIELFRPGRFEGPVVYLDLDSTVVGPLDSLRRPCFTMLSDFKQPSHPASGVMSWNGDAPPEVYFEFLKDPQAAMNSCRRWPSHGDQGWIAKTAGEIARFEPGVVISYKEHYLKEPALLDRASVVAYHGRPRPWQVEELA